MDYYKIHNNLISRAKQRTLSEGIYIERHHIIPRCMDGDDNPENIAILTPEEHFLAHQLLVKMYPGHRGLIYGLFTMTFQGPTHQRNNNKRYGWVRRLFSKTRSEEQKGQPSNKKGRIYEEMYGPEKADELKKGLNLTKIDKTYEEIYGEEKAAEIKEAQSETGKGRKKLQEHKDAIKQSLED
jgi:hypothetical protein